MIKPAILVTGGAARIGAAIVRAFAAEGWHVVIHYLGSDDEAEALAATLPSAETVQCDLSDDESAIAMIDDLADRLDDWRVLVNSASVFHYDDVRALETGIYREAMQVNALTPARMAQRFLAHAKSEAGRCVIQVTDQKLANPNPDFFSYTMSKHALDATIAMLAMAAKDADDRVYGLAPGAILPSHDQTPEEIEVSHRLNPLHRKTEANEVAKAALLLTSGALRSGETLFVDSGQHLLHQDRDVIYLAREMDPATT
ncbi:FolM Alternative dihydrofolate reductase 1 [Altererythrobacter epoxidivorans]|uniref:FolM Alternative dihydrofolate reductase 1 n=1 Tax=Altererythrobacter epoxidivorans TaxID=361183 RepID=A0A0M4M863_9SPHN|nr:SDR family oxidoreductase [Altererythrobacter epoxidivorans]ALE16773.1 FolM Alternative dihydrofolate reductase 1 [Altererythrobacter epoxidivorans]